VVIPGLTGELIAPGDSQTLREHLLRFVGDPALRQACGSAGRTRVVECFSIDRMVRDNCRVYEAVQQAAGTAQR
jgi:glycosyltransferase involved in cell wall biosynthesis